MIDAKGNRHATPEPGIPPHMLEEPLNRAQEAAFRKARQTSGEPAAKKRGARKGGAKKAAKQAPPPATKRSAKKAPRAKAVATSASTDSGSGKEAE